MLVFEKRLIIISFYVSQTKIKKEKTKEEDLVLS